MSRPLSPPELTAPGRLHFRCRPRREIEGRHGRPEDIFGHSRHRRLDADGKRDLVQDVLYFDAGCNFDQRKALRLESEDSALGHVKNVLIILSRLLGAERQVLDLVDELLTLAFERKAETDQPRALGDIDKAAGADHAATQTRNIHVALLIDLTGAHERSVETAAVVKIKLARVRDDRRRMCGDAEVDAAGR